jgi:PIN domain nuclease of toxin-antitoxin system
MVRRLVVLAVLGTGFVAAAAQTTAAVSRPDDSRAVTGSERQSETDTRALDTLLERSGLRVQLESLSAGVRVQFLLGQGRLSGEDRLTIDRIVSQRFSAGSLYARMRLEFEKNLESAKLAKALEWYGSPLGKRITGLELASLIPDGGPAPDFEKVRPSERRLDLLRRLDSGGGASDTTVDVTMAIVGSLTRAFQPALPAVARLSPGQLEHELTQVRNLTLERIRRACLLNMLAAYRDLTDDELEQYVRFVESEGGQWYMSVMNGTLLIAVDAAAEATATELAAAVPQLARDLR